MLIIETLAGVLLISMLLRCSRYARKWRILYSDKSVSHKMKYREAMGTAIGCNAPLIYSSSLLFGTDVIANRHYIDLTPYPVTVCKQKQEKVLTSYEQPVTISA